MRLRVMTETTVLKIAMHAADAPVWRVETSRGISTCRVVVIATGQYYVPVLPSWPGRDEYGGTLLHSSAYANSAAFVGERVLVVGAGNSGAEIATDLAEGGAAAVALSVRTAPPIVARDPFGFPVQRASLALSVLPPAIADRIGWATARATVGDLTRYGMPAAEFRPYTTRRIPLIDAGFVAALKRGRVSVRPAVERLTASGAAFADGRQDAFDAIIAATGFRTDLASVLSDTRVLDAAGEPLGKSGEPTAMPGLYFIGFVHSLRGHLFEANRASRRLARHVGRYLRE
jgi:cation diffusion facilitator CzcD-associated flavoprotein CzcO